ncbi:MAG: universal stress protein [Brevundimonas sp.]|nr:universal stress protein [Brevundimonas sp.]
MTYKTLLVAVDDSADSDARVALACDLAVGMDAHLIGACGVALNLPPMEDPYTGGAMLGEAFTLFRDLAEAEVRSSLKRFHAAVGTRQDRTEWRGRLGYPADVVIHEARAADLLIIGRRSSRSPGHAVDPADVLMAVGRPVLIVPPARDRDPMGWPAVIAWKDSREAQRAAAAALPLLRHASEIHVLEVCDPDKREAARARVADVVAWLGRHGLVGESHVETPGQIGASEDILSFAAVQGAGLIVAGGYGHSRLREWALGGVTQDLMTDAKVCVLLSH